MPTKITCPGCSKTLSIKPELLGKKIKCPSCQKVLSIGKPRSAAPAAPNANIPQATPLTAAPQPSPQPAPGPVASSGEKLSLKCPCGSQLKVPSTARGKTVQCPKCSRQLKIPAAPAAPAPAAPVDNIPVAMPVTPMAAPVTPMAAPAADPFAAAADPFAAAADPFAAAPAAPQVGGPAQMPAPAPASGGAFWDQLNSPAASAPAAFAGNAAPAAPAGGAGGFSAGENSALAAAGAYTPSLEDKMGAAAASQTGPTGRSWGDYFTNRIHWALWGMMIVGPIIAVAGWMTQQKLANLEARGKVVQGVIMDGWEKRGRRSRSYYLKVVYKTEAGAPVTTEFGVTGSYYNSHELADMVEVKYDPEDPEQAILVGGSSDSSFTLYLGLIMAVIGTGGVGYSLFVGDIEF